MNPKTPRLLVIPGLHDSGPTHWQTLLQSGHRQAVRVQQQDWTRGDLDRWAERIGHTIRLANGGRDWLAVAHGFGCLALVRWLALNPHGGIRAALLVAPADPRRFDADALLPRTPLPVPTTMVVSENDPWMHPVTARIWAERWDSRWVHLGPAGHINAESGFGPFPFARRWVGVATQRLVRAQRVAEQRRVCVEPVRTVDDRDHWLPGEPVGETGPRFSRLRPDCTASTG